MSHDYNSPQRKSTAGFVASQMHFLASNQHNNKAVNTPLHDRQKSQSLQWSWNHSQHMALCKCVL